MDMPGLRACPALTGGVFYQRLYRSLFEQSKILLTCAAIFAFAMLDACASSSTLSPSWPGSRSAMPYNLSGSEVWI